MSCFSPDMRRASWAAIFVAAFVELVYSLCTVGLGSIVSLLMRCSVGQSMGERVAKIKLVKEVTVVL